MPKASKKRTSLSIIVFRYSYPYESSLLKLTGQELSRKHSETARSMAGQAQKIWGKYEKKVLLLFEKMYRIKVDEKFIEVFVSLIAPNSYSHPMTISFRRFRDIERSARIKRGFVYTVIHELAHYFSYTRPNNTLFNKLFEKVKNKNLLGAHGVNLHFLIQAVEFGIIGEVFGEKYAAYARNYVVKYYSTEYRDSAKALIDHNVPLDKTCLT